MDRLRRLGKYEEFQERVCTGYFGPIHPQIPFLNTPASIEMAVLLTTFLSFLMITCTFGFTIYLICMDSRKPLTFRPSKMTKTVKPILKRTTVPLKEVKSDSTQTELKRTNGTIPKDEPKQLLPTVLPELALKTNFKTYRPTPAPRTSPTAKPFGYMDALYNGPKPIPIPDEETGDITAYVSSTGALGRTRADIDTSIRPGEKIRWVYTDHGNSGS